MIGAIYDAAIDPSLWSRALNGIASSVGAIGGQFMIWDDALSIAPVSLTVGCDDRAADLYALHYGARDPRRLHLMGLEAGSWVRCHQVCDEGLVRRSEFYQDFLIPMGFRYIAGVRLSTARSQHAIVAIGRPTQGRLKRPFSDADAARLLSLNGHLSRAAEIHFRWSGLRGRLATLEAVDRHIDSPVLIVDRELRLRFANRRGEQWLQAPIAPLSLDARGALHAQDPGANSRLLEAVRGAMEASSGGTCKVQDRHGATHVLLVTPLRPDAQLASTWQRPLAMIVVRGATQDPARADAAWSAAFSLTRVETEVAVMLAAGKSERSIAESRGVTVNTVRAQARSIFSKMGVRRQSQLPGLISGLAWGSTEPRA